MDSIKLNKNKISQLFISHSSVLQVNSKVVFSHFIYNRKYFQLNLITFVFDKTMLLPAIMPEPKHIAANQRSGPSENTSSGWLHKLSSLTI